MTRRDVLIGSQRDTCLPLGAYLLYDALQGDNARQGGDAAADVAVVSGERWRHR